MGTALAERFYDSGPAFPLGYDNGLYEPLFPEDFFLPGDMRKEPHPGDQHLHYDGDAMLGIEYSRWPCSDPDLPIRSPPLSQQPLDTSRIDGVDASDSARSRLTPSGHQSGAHTHDWTVTNHNTLNANPVQGAESLEGSAGSAGSPEEKIFTPASSSHHDGASPNVRDSLDDAEAEVLSDASPASSGHTGSSHVSRPRYLPGATRSDYSARMNHHNLSERLTPVSAAVNFTATTPTTLTGATTAYAPHWLAPPQVDGVWMDGHGDNGQYDHIDGPVFYPGFEPYDDAPAGDYTVELPYHAMDGYALGEHGYRPMLPPQQAPLSWPHYQTGQSHHDTVLAQTQHLVSQQQLRTHDVRMGGVDHQPQRSSPSLPPHVADAPFNLTANARAHAIVQLRQQPSAVSQRPAQSLREPSSDRLLPSASSHPVKRSKDESDSPRSSTSSSRSTAITKRSHRAYPTLVQAEPRLTQSSSPGESSSRPRMGGRTSRLSDTAKQRTAEMRTNGACWRCIIQRDKCDGNAICKRCASRSQRAQTQHLACNREKIPNFAKDFLPPTMTFMHERQSIEDTVHREVCEFRGDPIDISFTTGYGPPLQWRVYEFLPNTPELLEQLQYFQDPETGMSKAYRKYSPPFGLLKLDSTDDKRVESYLEDLMTDTYLKDFGWVCFEEENEVDERAFQCQLLNLMCKLYLDTKDQKLKGVLDWVIRMMIITYIMGHTLTISEETLPSVLSHIKLSPRPKETKRHTSPRLANRQLKFFFAVLRLEVFNEILRWQQGTFHTSGKKEGTWLTSFCALLGLAMVLEEIQRTLQIQADAKFRKNEMAQGEAIREACNACDRIDERFDLLVCLFRWKYPGKKFGDGSFGPGTPEFEGKSEHGFLDKLRTLVEDNADHLASRRSVDCLYENQCQYTSRLVARFLLPFLAAV